MRGVVRRGPARVRLVEMAVLLARAVRRFTNRCLVVALLLGVAAQPALAAGVAPEAASADQKATAQTQYEQGVAAYKSGKYADAASFFGRSYNVVASPNSHIMYARALRESGKLDAAYEEFAIAQAEAAEAAEHLPKYAVTAQAAEMERHDLLKRVAALSLEVVGEPSKVTLYVGTREVPRDRWRAVAVAPGSVDVTARLPGGHRIWQSVEARVGSVVRVKLDVAAEALASSELPTLPPPVHHDAGPQPPGPTGPPGAGPAPQRRSLKPYAYIAGGVGAAGLLTFVIAGSMSRSTYNDLESACPGGTCPPSEAGKIDSGKTQQTVANVGLVIGLLGVGAGVTLFVMDQKASSEHAARHVDLVAGPGSMSLRGAF